MIPLLVTLGLVVVGALWLGASPAKTVRVALRMFPAQRDWIRQELFTQFEKQHRCRVEIVEFNNTSELVTMLERGEADLAKVDSVHAPVLVEKGLLVKAFDLGQKVDPVAFNELYAALRPEAIRLGTYSTITGNHLFLVPRKLETNVLAYRRSRVRMAALRFPALRGMLDARLQLALGHGLPATYQLHPDPAHWTTWDLLAAAFTWAQTPGPRGKAPGWGVRWEHLLELAVRAGAPASQPWGMSDAMLDVFEVLAMLRELDAVQLSTDADSTQAWRLLGGGELAAYMANQVDVGFIVGNANATPRLIEDANDLGVAPLPRLHGLELVGPSRESGALITGWGWGVPRNARQPELAFRLALFMLTREHHQAEIERFPLLGVRTDIKPTGQLAQELDRLGLAQFRQGGRLLAWPSRPGDIEQALRRIERAYRELIVERGYRGPGRPVDRARLGARLRELLGRDG
jgi:hypothetical protein